MCAFADSVFEQYGKAELAQAAVFAPRETWKTTSCVIGGVIDFLLAHPEEAVLIDSHVHERAQERLKAVAWHFAYNTRLHRYFGNWRESATLWNENEIRFVTREAGAAEPSISTAGTDQSKTGGHFGLIMADDLVNEKNSRTARGRQQIKDHIQTLYPLLKTGGIMFFCGTFWHYDDAYAWLLELDRDERDRAERLGQEQAMPLRTYIRGAFNNDGSLYAPYVLSYDKLEWLRQHMVPSLFAPNYLMVPIEESTKTFPKSSLSTYDAEFHHEPLGGQFLEFKDGRRVPVLSYLLWDPAGYKGEMLTQESSSDHGIVVVLVDPAGEWYVHEADGIKGFASEIIRRVVYLTKEYHPKTVRGEWVGSNEQWQKEYLRALRDEGVHLPSIDFVKSVPTMAKPMRIELGLEPRYRRREIHFRKGLEAIRKQLDEFPKSSKMDVLDALAQGSVEGKDISLLRGPTASDLEPRRVLDPDEDDTVAAGNAEIIRRAGAWTGTSTPVPVGKWMERTPWQKPPSPSGTSLRKALQHLGRGP